jgi:hypothetical protein
VIHIVLSLCRLVGTPLGGIHIVLDLWDSGIHIVLALWDGGIHEVLSLCRLVGTPLGGIHTVLVLCGLVGTPLGGIHTVLVLCRLVGTPLGGIHTVLVLCGLVGNFGLQCHRLRCAGGRWAEAEEGGHCSQFRPNSTLFTKKAEMCSRFRLEMLKFGLRMLKLAVEFG